MYGRSLYGKLSVSEESRLLEVLDRKERMLPAELVKDIRFDIKLIVDRKKP